MVYRINAAVAATPHHRHSAEPLLKEKPFEIGIKPSLPLEVNGNLCCRRYVA